MTIGIRYANAGTICIASSTGVMNRWKRSDRPASTPSGSPIASDSDTDAIVRANVWTLASQRPINANEKNATRTPSAARRPPKRSTTSVPSTVVPAQVSFRKNDVSQPTRLSRKFAIALKMRKTMLGCGTLRLLLSHAWKLSRSCESEFQVSDAGHGTWLFQPKNAITMPTTIATISPARPRHQGRGAGAASVPATCATAFARVMPRWAGHYSRLRSR